MAPDRYPKGVESAAEESNGVKSDVPKIQPIRKPLSVTALSVAGLLALALFYTLYFARSFFLPVTLALMLSILFKPVVRGLRKLHIPEAMGAAFLLLAFVSVVGLAVFLLSDPATKWLQNAPAHLQKIEGRLRSLIQPAQRISEAAETVENLAEKKADNTPKVELEKPGLLDSVWLQTKGVAYTLAEVFILLYFFLAAGDVFTLKLIQILPSLKDKKRAVEIARKTEQGVSRYLISMTIVNLCEGTAIGIGLWLLGMPNPLLWGVMAFFANYIPYIGALAAGTIVTIVALVSFDSVGRALGAPAIYFGVNFTDNFIMPYIVGRRLVLNPVIVFLAVMFWGWLWGIAGVLLAVPITMTVKILCEHVSVLAPYAEFLSAADNDKLHEEHVHKPALAKGNA